MNTLILAMYGEGKTCGKVSELLLEATTNQALAALVFFESASECRSCVKTFLAKSYEDMRRIAAGGVQPNLKSRVNPGDAAERNLIREREGGEAVKILLFAGWPRLRCMTEQ